MCNSLAYSFRKPHQLVQEGSPLTTKNVASAVINKKKLLIRDETVQTKTTKKRVTFAKSEERADGTIVNEEVIFFKPYENKQDLWYSPREEAQFRERDRSIGNRLRRGMDVKRIQEILRDSPRGLECMCPNQAGRRTVHRRQSFKAVMDEQERFRAVSVERNMEDVGNSIRKAYSIWTTRPLADAKALANLDARFVDEHVREKTKPSTGFYNLVSSSLNIPSQRSILCPSGAFLFQRVMDHHHIREVPPLA